MRMLNSTTGMLAACGLLLAACAAQEGESAVSVAAPGRAAAAGPVLARVDGWELRRGEVDELAAAAVALRTQPPLNLAAPPTETFEQRLGLAIELLSLAAAGQAGGLSASLVKDSRARALAAVYLDRLIDRDRRPIDDEDLKQAHLAEIHTFLTTGESELYAPTRVDLAIIGAGRFPSWSSYEDDSYVPVLSDEETFELATRIRAACGDRVTDLDAFEQIGLSFLAGNPTVRIEHHPRMAIDPDLFQLAPQIRTALDGLSENGAISQPVRTPGGTFIVRRGVWRPGKGEDLASIKDALARKVRRKRRQQMLTEHLQRLDRKLVVRTWPERLRDPRAEARAP